MAIALILVTVSMHGQFLQTSNVKDSLAQQTNTSAQTEAKSPNGNINKKVAVRKNDRSRIHNITEDVSSGSLGEEQEKEFLRQQHELERKRV